MTTICRCDVWNSLERKVIHAAALRREDALNQLHAKVLTNESTQVVIRNSAEKWMSRMEGSFFWKKFDDYFLSSILDILFYVDSSLFDVVGGNELITAFFKIWGSVKQCMESFPVSGHYSKVLGDNVELFIWLKCCVFEKKKKIIKISKMFLRSFSKPLS